MEDERESTDSSPRVEREQGRRMGTSYGNQYQCRVGMKSKEERRNKSIDQCNLGMRLNKILIGARASSSDTGLTVCRFAPLSRNHRMAAGKRILPQEREDIGSTLGGVARSYLCTEN